MFYKITKRTQFSFNRAKSCFILLILSKNQPFTIIAVLETQLNLRRIEGTIQFGVRQMKIEIERETDGRWIAEVPDLPGVMAYGTTRQDAVAKAEALALHIIADRLDHGEAIPELDELFAVPA